MSDENEVLGMIPLRQACNPRGGPDRLPYSPSYCYETEIPAGKIRITKIGRKSYISISEIRRRLKEMQGEAAGMEASS